jgi:group I intron endonuclease
MIPGLYKITNNVTGRIYVGSSYDVKSRLATHMNLLKSWDHHNTDMVLDRALYGVDSFQAQVIAYCEPWMLYESEKKLLEIVFISHKETTYNTDNQCNNRMIGCSILYKRYKESMMLKNGLTTDDLGGES